MDICRKAQDNLAALAANPYPGRGLIIGLSHDSEHLVQVYWIMGRSDNSRNRIFVAEDRDLRTAAADTSKVKDPSLIIYRAMAEREGLFVVSNGNQTDTVMEGDENGICFENSLHLREYEPDGPNFTPRITAINSLRSGESLAMISVLKKSEFGDECIRCLYRYDNLVPGYGYCVTTYTGDGNPLPSFFGEPFVLPLGGDITAIAKNTWEALNEENRISLAVKFINNTAARRSSNIVVVNKYELVY